MLTLTRRTVEIAAFIAALLIATMALHAWLASRNEQTRLASTLSAQKQLLDAAASRETARQSALNDTLAQIDALKRAALTPAQIVSALPQYLPLPRPITLAGADNSARPKSKQGTDAPQTHAPVASATSAHSAAAKPPPTALPPSLSANSPAGAQTSATPGLPSAPGPEPGPAAQIPAVDLKPLYDFAQDCRACQAKLAAAAQDKLDDDAKIAALQRERDAAITASKGGTFWRRLRRNALWFVVGAGAAAAAHYALASH